MTGSYVVTSFSNKILEPFSPLSSSSTLMFLSIFHTGLLSGWQSFIMAAHQAGAGPQSKRPASTIVVAVWSLIWIILPRKVLNQGVVCSHCTLTAVCCSCSIDVNTICCIISHNLLLWFHGQAPTIFQRVPFITCNTRYRRSSVNAGSDSVVSDDNISFQTLMPTFVIKSAQQLTRVFPSNKN